MANTRPPRQLERQSPSRRPRHRYRPKSRRRIGWRGRLAVAGILMVTGLLGWAVLARHLAPAFNTDQSRFDAIIVLGYPADSDGNPTPEQLARVTEAVHEYERDVATRIIMTGGAAHNRFVEAKVMARTAEAQGIPASAIMVEPEARDTIENACYSVRIMKEHGWDSAEVVSSASHLRRAALIFSRLPVKWRAHAAPPLRPESGVYSAAVSAVETLKTLRYLTYARWAERCQP